MSHKSEAKMILHAVAVTSSIGNAREFSFPSVAPDKIAEICYCFLSEMTE